MGLSIFAGDYISENLAKLANAYRKRLSELKRKLEFTEMFMLAAMTPYLSLQASLSKKNCIDFHPCFCFALSMRIFALYINT
ncbi:hypothetical protein ACJX0J_029736, partial [Zea mays]